VSFFFAILLSIFLGDIVCWRLAHRALRGSAWRWVNAGFFLFQLGVLVIVFVFRARGLTTDLPGAKVVLAAVYIWHLVLLPLALVAWLVARLVARGRSADGTEDSIAITRRRFLALATGGGPMILCAGATAVGLRQVEQFRIRRLTVPIPNLPPALEGLTIAQVSDVHVGRFTQGAVLERIVAASNALGADLIAMTGDLINFELRDLPRAIELTRQLRAAHGVFLCEGNHDLIEDGAQFVERVKRAGLRLLVDEAATLRIRGVDVQMLGLRWHSRVRALGDGRAGGVFPILLAHHPHAFDFAEGIPLTLSGHTHGGQLMLTEDFGCGPAFFRYWSGLYRREDRALVVSNGVGNWLPLRTRAPAEIVHLTLRTA
jgi:hypothetical protein